MYLDHRVTVKIARILNMIDLSALLLDRAYIQLSESNRRHLALQYILKVLWSEGIENANAYLTARKLDCLSI